MIKSRFSIVAAAALSLPLLSYATAQDTGTPPFRNFDGVSKVATPVGDDLKLRQPSPAELAAVVANAKGQFDANARMAALYKLRRLHKDGERQAQEPIVERALFEDRDPVIRAEAALFLCELKKKEPARSALAKALDPDNGEKDPIAQFQLIYAAASTHDARYVDSLTEIVRRDTEPLKIRGGAAVALRQCDKDKRSVPVLIRVFRERLPRIATDSDPLLVGTAYALRRLDPAKGAAWMTAGQSVIDRMHERHPNLAAFELVFGFIAGKFL